MNAISAVWKFVLPPPNDFVTLEMPIDAEPLCVQVQAGQPCLWARVHPKADTELRSFRWAGTGHHMDDENVGRYVGSWQEAGGALVWHLFEIAR